MPVWVCGGGDNVRAAGDRACPTAPRVAAGHRGGHRGRGRRGGPESDHVLLHASTTSRDVGVAHLGRAGGGVAVYPAQPSIAGAPGRWPLWDASPNPPLTESPVHDVQGWLVHIFPFDLSPTHTDVLVTCPGDARMVRDGCRGKAKLRVRERERLCQGWWAHGADLVIE